MSKPETVNRDWDELDEKFASKLRAILEQANRETSGKYPEFAGWAMFEGYRSQERQDHLYAQGRTRPGAKVTWTQESHHTGRRAADVVWLDKSGRWRWDGPARLWARLGHAVRTHGLTWGGDWMKKDLPHIEMTGTG